MFEENSTDTPFGTPPAGFMQTGNQVDPNNFDQSMTVGQYMDNDQFQMPVSSSDFSANIQEKQKYKIFDLFWLINPKFYNKQQPAPGESHIVIISYNADFGNLRISFFNLTNNSIQNNLVYLENLKRTVVGTIYPATAFNAYNTPNLATICLEQLFRQIPGATWQQERPVCTIQKGEGKIRFNIKDPKNGEYFYDFIGWQRDAFLHACKFIYTTGFEILAK